MNVTECAHLLLSVAGLTALQQVQAASLFESSENELSLTGSETEIWLERRAGAWGKGTAPSRILHSQRNAAGDWQPLFEFDPVMSDGDVGDPFYHAASDTLYFTSTRPHPVLGESEQNIWRIQRVDGIWREPEALHPPVNSAGIEYSPVKAGDRLYFASYRDGQGDLHVASETDSGWRIEPLGPAINSATGEWNLWVSDDEALLVFEASERSGNVSVSGDLYASMKDAAGRWLPAVPLHDLNGAGSELNPRPLGDDLVYASSSRQGTHTDLYRVPRASVIDAVERAYEVRLHAVSRSSHRVREFNLLSGEKVRDRPIGPGPHLLAIRGSRLAVAAYGEYPRPHDEPVSNMPGWVQEDGGALLIDDGSEQRVQLACRRPHGAVFDASGDRLWVTCEDQEGVVGIDLRQQPPAPELLRTNQPGAHVIAYDERRDQLLVAHTEAGGVSFLNPATGEADFLRLAPGAEALHLDKGRDELWVTLGPSGAVSVVGLAARAELARLEPGCGFPIDFALDGHERLWVACFGSQELVAFDRATRAVVDRLSLPAGPLNIEAHPSLPVLYASLPRQNRVVEISLTGRGITRRFDAGIEPDGLVLVPGVE